MSMLELLSRHWAPSSASTSGGRGGVPEMTEMDISHALGYMGNKRDRDLIVAIWSDNVTRQLKREAEADFRGRLIQEQHVREHELVVAKLQLHIMECELEGINNKYLQRKALHQYRSAVERARGRQWPWDARVYQRIFTACAKELREPRDCPDCNGRREVIADKLKITCPGCEGTGKKPYMKTDRAEAIIVPYISYRQTWHKVYEWGFSELKNAQSKVLEELGAVLERGALKTA